MDDECGSVDVGRLMMFDGWRVWFGGCWLVVDAQCMADVWWAIDGRLMMFDG